MQTRSTNAAHTPSTPNAFAGLAERLNQWRSTRCRSQRIPEALWNDAVSLARHHGLSPTATALKLSYYDLRRRMGGSPRESKPVSITPAFVEIPHSPGSKLDLGTVELFRPNGSRLTLRLSNPKSRDLLPLVQAFLRA